MSGALSARCKIYRRIPVGAAAAVTEFGATSATSAAGAARILVRITRLATAVKYMEVARVRQFRAAVATRFISRRDCATRT